MATSVKVLLCTLPKSCIDFSTFFLLRLARTCHVSVVRASRESDVVYPGLLYGTHAYPHTYTTHGYYVHTESTSGADHGPTSVVYRYWTFPNRDGRRFPIGSTCVDMPRSSRPSSSRPPAMDSKSFLQATLIPQKDVHRASSPVC